MEPRSPAGNPDIYHVVAIPWPGRGHINAMMNLCRLLASKGLLVTVVVTEEWRGLLNSGPTPWPPNLRFRTIPDVLPSERTRGGDYPGFVHAIFTKMEAPVEALIEGLDPPVDSVVTDSLLRWAGEICGRRGIPVSSLWTESATLFLALHTLAALDDAGRLPAELSAEGNEPLAYLPKVTPHFVKPSDASSLQTLRGFMTRYSWLPTAQSLVFTSFYELESRVIDTLRPQLPVPVYSPGPCIPFMTLSQPATDADAASSSSYFKWLDSQPESSVLYVSLGSFLPFSGPQMDEMAMGLQESRVRFMWVTRGELQGMEEASRNLGLVVPWCDQLRVLCHPAVGGFLTHCGWNSTLEGVFSGVPMITFPLIWDQYSNSKLVVDDWEVGLRLKDEAEERVIGWEEIARVVKELMDLSSEESKGRRSRVAELRDKCRKAIEEGGSSSTSLDAFVQGMARANWLLFNDISLIIGIHKSSQHNMPMEVLSANRS